LRGGEEGDLWESLISMRGVGKVGGIRENLSFEEKNLPTSSKKEKI